LSSYLLGQYCSQNDRQGLLVDLLRP